jgi:hypothetical protein
MRDFPVMPSDDVPAFREKEHKFNLHASQGKWRVGIATNTATGVYSFDKGDAIRFHVIGKTVPFQDLPNAVRLLLCELGFEA